MGRQQRQLKRLVGGLRPGGRSVCPHPLYNKVCAGASEASPEESNPGKLLGGAERFLRSVGAALP